MIFADSHTHLYSREFENDLNAVIGRAKDNGVRYLFLPNTDSESYGRMMQVVNLFPAICHPMTGLHPTSVKADYKQELDEVVRQLELSHEQFCAVGEIGIDLYWDKTFEKEQHIAFNIQLDLAVKYDLPVVIHTRNSMDVALEVLTARNDPAIRGVFHCFSGNTEQANRAIGLGFYLGIGGVVTYKNSGLQNVVLRNSLEHLLLETDAPYLPPVPHRGQRNEPAFIPLIARRVAEIKNISIADVAAITTKNTLNLFGIKPVTNDQSP